MPTNQDRPERPDYDAADADVQAKKAAQTPADELPDPHLDDDEVDSAGDPVEAGRRRAQLKAAQSRQPVGSATRPVPPPPVDPNADVIQEVKVDLAVEIPKLMQKRGLSPAEYNAQINLTNWEFYKEIILAYYQGRDSGYTDGYRLAQRSIFRRVRIYTGITAAVGSATVLWAIVEIIRHLHWG